MQISLKIKHKIPGDLNEPLLTLPMLLASSRLLRAIVLSLRWWGIENFHTFTIKLKRFLSISLLALYLNSFTEVHEVFRLPLLFEHYAEHKLQVNDMSFVEFLVMHYKTDVAHDDHDNQLPFKVPGHSFTAISITVPPLKISLNDETSCCVQSYVFDYKESYFSSSLQAIFQPPKLT